VPSFSSYKKEEKSQVVARLAFSLLNVARERKKERGESLASFSSCPVALISLNASDFIM
jgi:hypothetical protein